MNFEAFKTSIINKWTSNKELENKASIEEFLNNGNNLINLYNEIMNTLGEEQFSGEELAEMKNLLTKAGKTYKVDFSELNFDKNFGKFDKKREIEQKKYLDMAIRHCMKDAICDRYITKTLPEDFTERQIFSIINGMAQDYNDLSELVRIFADNSNDKIKGYDLTPSQLKEKLLIKQLNRIESMCEFFSKERSDVEIASYLEYNRDVFMMAQEVDGKKLDQFITRCKIERTPELEAKLAEFEKYKSFATSTSMFTVMEAIKANPLYKYANVNDLIDFSLMCKENYGPKDAMDIVGDKLGDKMMDVQMGDTKLTQLGAIEKVTGFLPTEQAKKDKEGKINNEYVIGTMKSIMKIRAEAEHTDFEKLQFFDSKHKPITIGNKDKDKDLYAKLYDLACKGETITIKDQTGKFIDYYETSKNARGLNTSGKDKIDFSVDQICSKFERDVKSNVYMGNEKFTLGKAQTKLDEMLHKGFGDVITELANDSHLQNYIYDNGKALDEDLKDICEMFTNLQKNLDEIDNFQICIELKTIKTFCQAYLDANCDSKDKKMIENCKFANKLFKSFQGIEVDMKRIENCEENLKLEMQLAGKLIDDKEIEEYNNVVGEKLNSTIQKKQAFDFDPTINLIDDKKSQFIEKDDPNKKLEKQMNDLNK